MYCCLVECSKCKKEEGKKDVNIRFYCVLMRYVSA